MKITYIVILLFILTGCATKKNVAGKYIADNYPEVFKINSDSTFKSEFRMGHSVKYSDGKWQRGQLDTLILSSNIQETPHFKLAELDKSSTGTTQLFFDLQIKNRKDLSSYECYIFSKDHATIIKSCDSLSSIKLKQPVFDISITFLKKRDSTGYGYFPVAGPKWSFKTALKNDVKITSSFNDFLFSYNVINKRKVIVKRNKILVYNEFLGKWEILYKVPDKVNIFIHDHD